MTMSDPIADMLTRIRNANTAKHDTVDVPSSKMKLAIANILLDEGYIEKYELIEDGVFKTIHITLKYGADKNEKVITGLKRISKPGLESLRWKRRPAEGTWWTGNRSHLYQQRRDHRQRSKKTGCRRRGFMLYMVTAAGITR